MTDKPRRLYVPDLSRPPGADVDAHGEVACVACGKHVDVTTADIVGKGYRCATCSALATPEDNADASLSPSEQAHVPDVPPPSRFFIAGGVLAAIGVIMWITGFDIPSKIGHHHGGREMDLFTMVFIAAVGCFALGFGHHRKWR